MTATLGKDSSLLMCPKTGVPIDTADGYDLISESLADEKENFVNEDGITGGRQFDIADEILLAARPGGSFIVRPRITQMSDICELILGGGDDAKWYPHADGTLLPAQIQVSHAAAYIEEYVDYFCDEAVISSEQNRPLQVEIIGLAKTCTEKGSPIVPDYANIKANAPILHSDLVITGSAGITGAKPFRYQLRTRNNIDPEGFANSADRQFLEPAGFDAELELEVQLDATLAAAMAAAYEASPKTPLEVIATYTQTALSVAISFQGVLTSPVPTIDSPGRQRYTLTFAGRALWAGTPYAITKNIVEVVVVDAVA